MIRKSLTVLFTASLLGIAGLFLFQPTKTLHTEIEIEASPEQVWRTLTTFEEYGQWNPFIRSITGTGQEGQKLTVNMKTPDGEIMQFTPTVLKASQKQEFRWKGQLILPGLFDGEHYFTLEKTAKGTRLVHGEIFNGVLLHALDIEPFKTSFEQMNQALKTRVEQNRNWGKRSLRMSE